MTASRIATRKDPKTAKCIGFLIYFVAGVGFITFGRETVWDMLSQYKMYQNDMYVNLISALLGCFIVWIVMFCIKRRSKII